jgi:hypothetical protein
MNCYSDGWEDGWGVKVEMETLAMNCNGYGFGIVGVKGTWELIKSPSRRARLMGLEPKFPNSPSHHTQSHKLSQTSTQQKQYTSQKTKKNAKTPERW